MRAKLHKLLTKLVSAGHGRKPVLVSKTTFSAPLEADGVTRLDVEDVVGPEAVPWADGDGYTMRDNGAERLKVAVTLVGDFYERPQARR